MNQIRLYAPFVKDGNHWKRATRDIITEGSNAEYPAYTKQVAVIVYQNWLLAPLMSDCTEIRELRPTT